jgi:hypothetical protein
MWWKFLIDVGLAFLIVMAAEPFWSIIKSRAYIASVLQSEGELRRFIELIGRDALRSDAAKLEPVFGSWMENIAFNTRVHFKALAHTRNLVFLAVASVIVGSFYFLGPGFAFANLLLFLVLAFRKILTSAANQNLTLVHSVLTNLYRWYSEDPNGAARDCPASLRVALSTVSHSLA